jgi:uncharacterized membrane protein YeiH
LALVALLIASSASAASGAVSGGGMMLASAAATASSAASATASLAATATTAAPSGLEALVESTVPSAVAGFLPSLATTTTPITQSLVTIPAYLEVSAAFAGALAGAIVGVERKFDIVGVATLAVVSGLGGGMIRDVLLQKYGIYALQNPRVLIATLVAALMGFFFFTAATKARPLLFLVDALSLGLFCVLGSDKALLAGLAFIPAILLGTITSVGGGVLRDVLTNQEPHVLQPGGFYATASALGATLYVLLVGWLNIVKPVAMIAVVLFVLSLRLLSEWLGWQSPIPMDLTPKVVAVPRRVYHTSSAAFETVLRAIGVPVHAADEHARTRDAGAAPDEWDPEDKPPPET